MEKAPKGMEQQHSQLQGDLPGTPPSTQNSLSHQALSPALVEIYREGFFFLLEAIIDGQQEREEINEQVIIPKVANRSDSSL